MGMRHRAYKRRQAAKRRQGADRFDERARALVAAGAFEPIAWPRALVVVGVLTAGAVAALSIAWPLAVVAALIAIRLDRTEEAPFALHRAATLVGIERSAPRRGWRRYLPLERAGPDVVLSRPLNGVLLLAVIASFALVFVNLTLLTLTAVLLAAYACVGRPERAWVPKHAVRTLRSLADQAPDQVAAPTPASAPAADPVAPAASAASQTPVPAARRDRLPTTGPAIVAEIDALARAARPSIPPEAMATIGRIRELAAQALPTHDRDLNFSDHETWLVRQVACDYLPAAIEGVSRHRSAARDAAARRRSLRAPGPRRQPRAHRAVPAGRRDGGLGARRRRAPDPRALPRRPVRGLQQLPGRPRSPVRRGAAALTR